MAVVVKLVNTLDCGSSMRAFEPRRSPHMKIKHPLKDAFFAKQKGCYAFMINMVRIKEPLYLNLYSINSLI